MPMKGINSKIRGVTLPEPHTDIPRQRLIKKLVRRNTQLRAVLEPDNPADEEAVAVYVKGRIGFLRKKKLYHLGYLSGAAAKMAHAMILTQEPFAVVVNRVTGGTRKKPTRGVNVRLMFETKKK